MNLDEFVKQVPLTLVMFEECMKRLGLTDPTMNPNTDRPEEWWWNDVSAYLQCIALDEKLKQSGKPGMEQPNE